MAEEPKSWWHTVPGILTAITGVMTALSGLLVTLHQTGVIEGKQTPASFMQKFSADSAKAAASSEAKADEPIQPVPAKLNLLAKENGGHIVALPNDDWEATIDGDTDSVKIQGGETINGEEAVYAFKDEQLATFDTFEILIPEPGDNIKKFELLVTDDPTSGPFQSLGHFQTQNLKFIDNPYQAFKFSPVSAKYLKVKLESSYGEATLLTEFRLQGRLMPKLE